MKQEIKEIKDAKELGAVILKFSHNEGDLYFRKPNKTELLLYFDTQEETGMLGMERFVRRMLIYPLDDTLNKLLTEKPLAFKPIFDILLKDSGIDENFMVAEI